MTTYKRYQTPLTQIPEDELKLVAQFIRSEFQSYPSDNARIKAYEKAGYSVISNPGSDIIVDLIIDALEEQKPFSVVRIGDGEGNLMTYLKYPNTPVLDQYVARAIITMQEDSFEASKLSLLLLRDLMNASARQADILGVRGIWGAYRSRDDERHKSFDDCMTLLKEEVRGKSGLFRATHHTLNLCQRGDVRGATVASAHLYIAVLRQLSKLVESSKAILLITSHKECADIFKERWPHKPIHLILVGNNSKNQTKPPKQPNFLLRLYKNLPYDLQGTLCLVGSGPWSEIYCSYVKERGGVAVDIGSGFDIIRGASTRPIHNHIQKNYPDALPPDITREQCSY
ncbi:hypothetical protein SynA1840_01814 [Synechococcus sp. A18-40]|nr:hypothetical protein SynA1840_01814 [Synechococcus sp. A18-40]